MLEEKKAAAHAVYTDAEIERLFLRRVYQWDWGGDRDNVFDLTIEHQQLTDQIKFLRARKGGEKAETLDLLNGRRQEVEQRIQQLKGQPASDQLSDTARRKLAILRAVDRYEDEDLNTATEAQIHAMFQSTHERWHTIRTLIPSIIELVGGARLESAVTESWGDMDYATYLAFTYDRRQLADDYEPPPTGDYFANIIEYFGEVQDLVPTVVRYRIPWNPVDNDITTFNVWTDVPDSAKLALSTRNPLQRDKTSTDPTEEAKFDLDFSSLRALRAVRHQRTREAPVSEIQSPLVVYLDRADHAEQTRAEQTLMDARLRLRYIIATAQLSGSDHTVPIDTNLFIRFYRLNVRDAIADAHNYAAFVNDVGYAYAFPSLDTIINKRRNVLKETVDIEDEPPEKDAYDLGPPEEPSEDEEEGEKKTKGNKEWVDKRERTLEDDIDIDVPDELEGDDPRLVALRARRAELTRKMAGPVSVVLPLGSIGAVVSEPIGAGSIGASISEPIGVAVSGPTGREVSEPAKLTVRRKK
jgi:hypothetical protein